MDRIHRSILPSLPELPNLSYTSFLFNYRPRDGPARRPDPTLQPCLLDAAVQPHRPIFLADLEARVERLAAGFIATFGSLPHRTVVSLHCHNCPDFVVIALAVIRLGWILCPLSTAWSPAELRHIVKQAKPSILLTHDSIAEAGLVVAQQQGIPADRIIVIDGERPGCLTYADVPVAADGRTKLPPKLEDVPGWKAGTADSVYLTSSGTTGLMKVIRYSHQSLNAGALQKMIWRNSATDPWRFDHAHDRCLASLPFFHMGGLVGQLIGCLFANTTVVCIPVSPRFHLETTLQQMVEHEITLAWLVPTQLRLMVQDSTTKQYVDRLKLRHILASTAPVSEELERQVRLLLPRAKVMQVYGFSEGGGAVTTASLSAPSVSGSAGQLFSDVDIRIVDPDSLNDVPPGQEGECIVRTPCMTLGYLDNPQANSETFLPNGWLRTGDVVKMKGDDLFITDRLKSMIKVKGFQVSPAELEGILIGHPSVLEVVVVPIYDPHAIEVPCAYIVPSPDAARRLAAGGASTVEREVEELKRMVADRVASYKALAGGVRFVDEIPRLPSSKQNRNLVKEWAKQADLKRWGEARARL